MTQRPPLLLLLATLFLCGVSSLKVLVTGAGGRTGKLVFEQLQQNAAVSPVGFVRSKKAVKTLRKAGASDSEIIKGDTTDEASLTSAMAGCDSVILCTSAVPQILKRSLVKLLFKKTILRSKEPGRPEFKFGPGGTPEEVDWLGAKKQIDAAKAAGVKRFVFVSSMGGTQPDNFLNSIGRQEQSPAPTTHSRVVLLRLRQIYTTLVHALVSPMSHRRHTGASWACAYSCVLCCWQARRRLGWGYPSVET